MHETSDEVDREEEGREGKREGGWEGGKEAGALLTQHADAGAVTHYTHPVVDQIGPHKEGKSA